MSEGYARSDLACESDVGADALREGISQQEKRVGDFLVSSMRIGTAEAAARLEKPMGTYITVDCGRINHLSEDNRIFLAHLLSEELRSMAESLTGKELNADFEIFVAGLGNAELTADAIGPRTVHLLNATRHLREHEQYLYRIIGCTPNNIIRFS